MKVQNTPVPAIAPNAPELGYEEIADRLVPSEPRISPNGEFVACTVSTQGKKDEHPKRAIWLSRQGTPAKRFSGGESNDHDIAWSPDSTRLAFLSNRSDPKKDGLYLLPIDGGEAQRLGETEGSLDNLRWSPDGKTIAFLKADPETDAEEKRKEEKNDPVVIEEELKNVRIWLADVETGKARCLTFGQRSILDYAWAPDGAQIVFIATPLNTINARFLTTSLWRIPVTGGLATRVADFLPAPRSLEVREINDEQVIALIASGHRDDPSPSVWSVPFSGGNPVNLLPGLEGAVQELIADPASPGHLIVRIVEGTHGRLYRLSAAGGELTPLTPAGLDEAGSVHAGPTVAADGRSLAFVWTKSDLPEELYLCGGMNETKALTTFGEPFKDRLSSGEIVSWPSPDDVEIEGVLLHPRGYQEGKRYPLVVQVHGGPSWQWEDRVNLSWHDWGQMLTSRGYAVLMPNPRGSSGRGSEFERLLQDDVGGGESQDLIAGAQAMVERGIADPDRLAIAGWSWGGYLTAWTITQTTIFRAAVMGAGLANLISDHGAGDIPEANTAFYPGHPYTDWDIYADRSPLKFVTNVVTPTLILHGENDERVSPTQGLEYYRALQVLGVPVRFVRYPREGHGIQERHHQLDLMRRIVEWLEQHLS